MGHDLPIVNKKRAAAGMVDVPQHAGPETATGATPPIIGEHEMEHGKPPGAPAGTAPANDPAWKAPLSNAFSAISGMVRGQDEDFLPPPEMLGIIPRPQPIAYQPIPYQPPILRRY